MSIIFDKLKNLRKKPIEQHRGEQPGLQTGDNIYTFRKLIFSTKGTLLISGLIAGIGCVSFFSLSLVKSYLDDNSSKAIAIQAPAQDNLSASGIYTDEADPGLMIPGNEPQMDSRSLSDTRTDENRSTGENIKFEPPEFFQHLPPSVEGEDPDIPEEPESVASTQMSVSSRPSVLQKKRIGSKLKPYADMQKKDRYEHQLPRPDVKKSPVFFKMNSTSGSDRLVFKEKNLSQKGSNHIPQQIEYKMKKQSGLQKEDELGKKNVAPKRRYPHKNKDTKMEQAPKENQILKKKLDLTNKDLKYKDQEANQEARFVREKEKIRLEKLKKTQKVSEMAMLSDQLEDAIAKNDEASITRLFQQLFEQNKAHSSYVLNLKAYKAITEKKYGAARRLLNKVLEKDQANFDAGINMAIIEIRSKEFKKAQKRLLQLKERYPSKSIIDDLLEQL